MSSETKQKKTKGRNVPSRYKQSADSTQSSSGTSSETMKVFRSYAKTPSHLLSSTTVGSSNKNETDLNLCIKTTSTPDQNYLALPTFDASAIASTSGSFCVSQRKEIGMQSMLSTTTNKNSTHKKTPILPTSGPIRCKELKSDMIQAANMQKLELDLYYGQYQLSLLLENKLQKSVRLRSEVAMEKIYKVLNFIGVLLGKNGTLQKGLYFLTYIIKLNEHLQKQEEILLPSLELISILEKQYEEIAVSVDSTRHKLQVKDVSLPNVGLEDEVMQLLENINDLLEQIQANVSNIDEVNLLAKNANTIVCQGKLIAEEIKRGSELVSEARELLLSETSCQLAKLSLNE